MAINPVLPVNLLDDKELRKAWLKKLFASYEYRLHLLQIHQQWVDIIKNALKRARAEEEARHGEPHPTDLMVANSVGGPKTRTPAAKHFEVTYLPLIERVPPPEKYTREVWQAHQGTSGGLRAVGDYGRYIGNPNYWEWMTAKEKSELDQVWAVMAQVEENIRRTIDKTWEKNQPYVILDPLYTGPIDWPSDWKQELLGERGVSLEQLSAPRVKAGEPVTVAGTYEAIDRNERRFKVRAGDVLPDIGSAYGTTIWVRVED